MKRPMVIFLVTVLLVVFVMSYFWLIHPRVLMSTLVMDTYDEMELDQVYSEYFTGYDTEITGAQTIGNELLSLDIPADWELGKIGELSALYYHDADKTESVIILDYTDTIDMNIGAQYKPEDKLEGIAIASIMKAIKDMGYGEVTSRYGTTKCARMLKRSDYKFWNLNRGAGFTILIPIKSIMFYGEQSYIYEAEDKCGFVNFTLIDGVYHATVEMYSYADLDTAYTVMVAVKDIEQLYGIINSISFVE